MLMPMYVESGNILIILDIVKNMDLFSETNGHLNKNVNCIDYTINTEINGQLSL